MNETKRIIVGITGASGMIYAIRLLKTLLENPIEVFLSVSEAGKQVMVHETDYTGINLNDFILTQKIQLHEKAKLHIFEPDNLFAPPASGSFRHHGMVIVPCSMKTLGMIASGIADGLIHRAADVTLKEKRPLILVIRETPLNLIQIQNMQKVVQAGATVLPACPGFYYKPQTIENLVDSIVARILDHLGIAHSIFREWGVS